MRRTSQAFPIVVSGPSGVGKTTLIDRLVERDPRLRKSISTTTREPRDGEESGKHYFFVERDVFEQMKKRELIEWAEVHGEFYGTPRRFIEQEMEAGRDVVLNVDIQGADSVKRTFPMAVQIFILPPAFGALEARIRQRGGVAPEVLERRLGNARKEITHSNNYDYVVVNDDLDRALGDLEAIIAAERLRRLRQLPDPSQGFTT